MRQELDLSARPDWDRAITLQVGTVQETITVSERRSPAQVPAAAAGPRPLRVGGNIRAPRKLVDVHPVYPASMRESGREGVVPIEAIIGQDGAVTSVRVVSAQVHPDFAIAAVDAVRQWKFSPTLLNGAPVEVVMTVSVAFKLSDQ
jgi:protein TonB